LSIATGKQNLRTQFLRIIREAGVQPWGRLFAAGHYLQVRDSDFDRALAGGAKSAQNPAHWKRKMPRSGRTRGVALIRKTCKKP